MMRKVISLFFLLCTLHMQSVEFEKEMGKQTSTYVQTAEDRQKIQFFAQMCAHAQTLNAHKGIGPLLHLIWLGPDSLPEGFSQRVMHWSSLHPGWRIKLWMDHSHTLLGLPVEICGFDQFPLHDLEECYFLSENWGERACLLSYCILADEGGFYVDHDLIPLQNLEIWRQKSDFICGLQPLGPSIMSSSVIPSTAFIGAIPHHPVIEEAMLWLRGHWEKLGKRFPGQDSSSVHSRVMHRARHALDVGLESRGLDAIYANWVLPPSYFTDDNPESARYARHLQERRWLPAHRGQKETLQRKLSAMATRCERLSWVVMGCSVVSVTGFYLLIRRQRQVK